VLARLETLDETLSEHGLAPHSRILEYGFAPPADDARRALALERGEDVLFLRRVHAAETGPIAVALLSVPPGIGAQLARNDLEQHPIFEILPRLGLHTGRAVQSIRAEAAPADVAAALELAPGGAVLVCERVTYSTDEQPLVYAVFYYRADRFEFRVTLAGHTRDLTWALPGLAPLPSTEAPT
jgi:GntR family transcriptional regulator